jgi:hypothetical protein
VCKAWKGPLISQNSLQSSLNLNTSSSSTVVWFVWPLT